MKTVKMSLIDHDSVVQCQTDVHLGDADNKDLIRFLRQIRDELVIGQTASLQITHPPEDAFILTVSYSE